MITYHGVLKTWIYEGSARSLAHVQYAPTFYSTPAPLSSSWSHLLLRLHCLVSWLVRRLSLQTEGRPAAIFCRGSSTWNWRSTQSCSLIRKRRYWKYGTQWTDCSTRAASRYHAFSVRGFFSRLLPICRRALVGMLKSFRAQQ